MTISMPSWLTWKNAGIGLGAIVVASAVTWGSVDVVKKELADKRIADEFKMPGIVSEAPKAKLVTFMNSSQMCAELGGIHFKSGLCRIMK